ncbi:MAG TPA: APC family permease [Acidimicrobiales bacterium]|nr:APC family permease [Acidimicrobiales bacterium]
MLTFTKRVLIGQPLANSESDHQRLPKSIALATFSSDAISSTAYATEEILFVTAVGASSLTLGLSKLVPLAIVVALLLAIVSTSYRQTIFSYPSGGGSYIVSRENLGEMPSLVAGASLLVDYILTVAVSISSGVAAILSIPTFHHLEAARVPMCIGLLAVVTLANLRGVKESGRAFAVPTYVYIVSITAMVGIGLWRVFLGHYHQVPFDPHRAHDVAQIGGSLTLFLLLRGFSSGAVALTGVEAISNGVPAFRRPESRNAATTLTWMALILGSLFLGLSVLASKLHPFPTHTETVNSQMARAMFGESPFYWAIQLSTCAILVLAANTAFADFPRLSSIIAKDGYLPRQFAHLGDRLVFSNGIVFLAIAASALIVIFGGIVTALIPLYAIGVFTSFTLSQSGMVRHHLRRREPAWRRSVAINSVGAVATFIVMLIVAITKFTKGAWVPIVIVPVVIGLFKAINSHYLKVGAGLHIEPHELPPQPSIHTFVVLVGRVHRGVAEALQYARSLTPHHIVALHIADEGVDHAEVERDWARFGFPIPLDIVDSPYRELTAPVNRYLDRLDARWASDRVTVVIPEFVVGLKSVTNILHGQNGLALKLSLLERPSTAVLSVPFHVGTNGRHGADESERRDPSKRLARSAPSHELDRARRAARIATVAPEGPRIATIAARERVTVVGEVTTTRVVPRPESAWLELTVDDGSGSIVAMFTGRRGIGGIHPGRVVEFHGVLREERGRRVMLNPLYTLLPDSRVP